MKNIVRMGLLLAMGAAVSVRGGLSNLSDLKAEASLVSDHAAIAPGTVFTLALRLQMPKDAYVYWRNPGDAGLPTQVKWDLPEGFKADALEWPVPGVFDDPPLRSFGYKGEALLFARVRAPVVLPDSGVLRFGAKSEWLICREACVPGEAQLELTIAIEGEARTVDEGKKLIQRFRDQRPEKAKGWTGTFTADSEAVAIRISIPDGEAVGERDDVLFVPYQQGLVEPFAPQERGMTDDGMALKVQRDVMRGEPGREMGGVLLIRRDGRLRRALEVSFTAD